MTLSVNWFNWACLIGGTIGAVRIATAKQFYKSDFTNQDGVITDEDRKTLVRMTPLRRWVLVAICVLIAILGQCKSMEIMDGTPFRLDPRSPEPQATFSLLLYRLRTGRKLDGKGARRNLIHLDI